MQVTIDKKANTITIVLPLQPPTPSASGKTKVIATTRGNQVTAAQYDGNPVTIGVNAYIK